MSPCWVVTGTDTEVGKSVVTAALAAGLREGGLDVRALKPIASGVPAGEVGEDAAQIALGADHEPLSWVDFRTPVSPHRAQALEGRTDLDEEALLAWIDGHRHACQATLIEGAGGWRVPLMLKRRGGTVGLTALARATDAGVVIVAADRLGVLNHTLLTVEAVRADGCTVQGVVLNRMPGPDDASRASNLADLQNLLDCPVHPFAPLDPGNRQALAAAGRSALIALRMRILAA